MSRTSAAAAVVLERENQRVEYAESEDFVFLEPVSEVEDAVDASLNQRLDPTQTSTAGEPREGQKLGSVETTLGGSMGSAVSSSADEASPLAAMSDQDLLEGIRAQSEPHFAELYRRYFQRIYNFVYARMRNHAETEEVVQETFLAVFRSFGNYRGQSSLLSWVYGIAKNTTNNSLRRAKSQNERIEMADDEDLIPRTSIDLAMPDEQLDLRRFREHLTERLDSVATWQAEIFEMRHFENLSIPEISARTSRSSDAVRSSLYRVKRLFFDAAMANGSGAFVAEGSKS